MSGKAFTLEFDISALQSNLARVLKKKAKKLDDIKVRNEIAKSYRKAIMPYVPKKTGKLRYSSYVSNGKIHYPARSKYGSKDYYGSYQYHIPVDPDNRTTPGTYDHWNRHLTAVEREKFYREAADIIMEAMKDV